MTIRTDGTQGLPQPGLDAAREGRAFCGWVNAKTGIDSESVLTDSTFIQEIREGKRLVMTCFYMNLGTASDSVTVEFVTTAEANGSGAITVKSPLFRIESGTVASPVLPSLVRLDPPLVVTRADGAALTAQVLGNDASAALTLGMHGWEEDDK